MSKLFNLDKIQELPASEYFICISKHDPNYYIFLKKNGDIIEPLLAENIKDKIEFEEKIKNLSKYFNAKVIEV